MPKVEVDVAAAAQLARDAMHVRHLDVRAVADLADLDPGTVGDFVAGTRWPRTSTRGRLEQVLGLPAGELERVARGSPPRPETLAALSAVAVLTAGGQPSPDARPVGLGLDDEAADLAPEQIEVVRAVIRGMKPPPPEST